MKCFILETWYRKSILWAIQDLMMEKHWKRKDEAFQLPKSEKRWDSEMACYPVVLNTKSNRYMFYNGNGMGKTEGEYGVQFSDLLCCLVLSSKYIKIRRIYVMMQWEKKGLVFGADKRSEWMDNSALQPTPILLKDRIRVFCGFRDATGVGRVGFVDLNPDNPSEVMGYSQKPCLDVGKPGCFDDNGVVPCAVTRVDNKLYLFYAGYNIGHHVRMTIFCGLAISDDDGITFRRTSNIPVMDRTDNEFLFRVIHTAIKTDSGWIFYYGAGNHFLQGKKKTLPVYEVERLEVSSLAELSNEGTKVVCNEGDEYRVGRPYVIHDGDIWRMFFGGGSEAITYKLAYAESKDGITWKRKDIELNLNCSEEGWDSEMMAYPSFVRYNGKAYLFYNGNNYGYEGFGYAELMSE